MVVQMAKAVGARVIATCGSDEKVELAKSDLEIAERYAALAAEPPRGIHLTDGPMKFTLNWLRDHLDTQASLDEITEALKAIGYAD